EAVPGIAFRQRRAIARLQPDGGRREDRPVPLADVRLRRDRPVSSIDVREPAPRGEHGGAGERAEGGTDRTSVVTRARPSVGQRDAEQRLELRYRDRRIPVEDPGHPDRSRAVDVRGDVVDEDGPFGRYARALGRQTIALP